MLGWEIKLYRFLVILLLLDCYLITDKGLIVLISDHDDLLFCFFLYNFQDYFSSYETGKSVTGGKGENPEKTNLHTQKQNLVYVTRDCKTDQLGSNLRRRVHCLGVGSCQNDIVALKVVLIHFIRCCVMLHQSLL